MKTLVTAIQKGGQGKTFAVCHLAFNFHEKRKLRVAVVDVDGQGDASFTLAQYDSGYPSSQLFTQPPEKLRAFLAARDTSGLTLITADDDLADLETALSVEQAAQALQANIEVMREFFDVCLIDTPPALGVRMTAALLVADYMLSPVEVEAYSVRGMDKMVRVFAYLREHNPRLNFLGMVPNRVDSRKPRHVANEAALREAYPDLVTPFSIGQFDSIGDALGECKPVWRIEKTAARKAAKEVTKFANYVFEKMEIAQ